MQYLERNDIESVGVHGSGRQEQDAQSGNCDRAD